MSKSRKSPRKRPTNTPPQEVKKPEQTNLLTRRNILIGLGIAGGATLAWRTGLLDVFKDEKKKEPETSDQKDKLSEYDEWASKIKIADINIKAEAMPWGFEDRAEKIFPGADKNLLGSVAQYLGETIQNLHAEYNGSDGQDKQRSIDRFGYFLEIAYREALGLNKDAKVDFEDVQKILLCHNVALFYEHNLSLHEIESAHEVQIEFNSKKYEIPMFYLKKGQLFRTKPESPYDIIQGRYDKVIGGALFVDPKEFKTCVDNQIKMMKGLEMPNVINWNTISNKDVLRDFMNSVTIHEGQHAALALSGFEWQSTEIRTKGDINMGYYILKEDEYRPFSDRLSIGELVGLGSGLANSGISAQLHMPFHETDQYRLATLILEKEIEHFISTNNDLVRKAIRQYRGVTMDCFAMMTNDDYHKIGERMAKLGIYLTQE